MTVRSTRPCRRGAPLFLLACLLAAPAAHADENDSAQNLRTRIKSVVVYADRAQVTRTGTIDLAPGGGRWRVTGLPGWVDAESVRATLSPPSSGRILDVSVERSFLSGASDESVRKAEAAVREIQDELAALNDEERVLNAEAQQLEGIRAFTMDKLPRDMATRDVKVSTFADTVNFVSDALRRNRERMRAVTRKKRDLDPELQARTKALRELAALTRLEQSTVVIEASGQGNASVSITYQTPGATWEPVGELRVTGAADRVNIVQFANVVQTTGEDWDDVALSFATQRPDEALGIPKVKALLVGVEGGLEEAVKRRDESFRRAASSYGQQNEIIAQTRSDWAQNVSQQFEVQRRATDAFQQLAGRGTTAHFQAQGNRTVRAHGRAVRVPIATADFDATVRVVAVPEVSLNAVRTADLRNTSDLPILPGRFGLFVDGAFVGHSSFPFVAPGEVFSAFLGVHERLKLERSVDRKRSSLERKSKRTTVRASFIISAENLSDTPLVIELGDRVPVAVLDDIEISDITIPEGAKRAADGVVRWTATIPPRKTLTWRIGNTMEYPNDLLSRGRAQPAAPAPQKQFYDDVERLEKSL
jgi:uncharacterized protein (TIGR02231 family)